MYQEHFNLNENPFNLTPDTNYFFKAQPYQEALETIIYSLNQNEGFIKITGPVGSGKTLLCRQLLNHLDQNFQIAYIPNPALSTVDFYKMVIYELGGETVTATDAFEAQKILNALLLKLAENNKRVVLVIDEAQTMPDDTLEAVRLLTNLETEKIKLLQIVLFGQEELDEKLNTKRFRQLRQRIVFSYYLRPLTKKELTSYIRHRVSEASKQYQELFSTKALKKIYKASKGVPRLINILCHKALISAYSAGSQTVEKKHLKEAIADTPATNVKNIKNEAVKSGKPNMSLKAYIGFSIVVLLALALLAEVIWIGVIKL